MNTKKLAEENQDVQTLCDSMQQLIDTYRGDDSPIVPTTTVQKTVQISPPVVPKAENVAPPQYAGSMPVPSSGFSFLQQVPNVKPVVPIVQPTATAFSVVPDVYSCDVGNGTWVAYDRQTCTDISLAFGTSAKVHKFQKNGQFYTIDVSAMTQTNDQYGTVRNIRKEVPSVTPSVAPSVVPLVSPARSSFAGAPTVQQPVPSAPSAPSVQQSMPTVQVQKVSAVKVPTQLFFFEKGQFTAFDATTATNVISSFVNGDATYSFSRASSQYEINFATMTQRNKTTQQTRRVRFDTEKVVLHRDPQNGYLTPYEKVHSDAILGFTGASGQIMINGQQYLIDLTQMTQTNLITRTCRSITIV